MLLRRSISVAPGRRGTKRRGVAAALAALLAAGGTLDTAAEPLVIEARPVALNPADPTQTRVGALVYLGGLELTSPDARFGGLSGLEIDAGNGRLLAVTDHGHWVAARLVLDGDGAPIGIAEGEIAPIRDHGGRLLSGSWGDAEGHRPPRRRPPRGELRAPPPRRALRGRRAPVSAPDGTVAGRRAWSRRAGSPGRPTTAASRR